MFKNWNLPGLLGSKAPQTPATGLIALPNEILHEIFKHLDPRDLGRVPRTCHRLHRFVKGNTALHRDIYLSILDVPPEGVRLAWEQDLQDLVLLERYGDKGFPEETAEEIEFVHNTVMRLLETSSMDREAVREDPECVPPTRNVRLVVAIFEPHDIHHSAFSYSPRWELAMDPDRHKNFVPPRQRQMSAKLHCLHGPPKVKSSRPFPLSVYPYACSMVYDLRNYLRLDSWGPFMNDNSGRVDWEKIEAVVEVLVHNPLERRITGFIGSIWHNPFRGSWPNSFFSPDKVPMSVLDARDPFGITGTWHRVVCFLDYNDFFTFNFPNSTAVFSDEPRPPIQIEQAVRLIVMRIHVTRIEEPPPEYRQDYPLVHFTGTSRPVDDAWDENATSDIRGMVGMMKEGEVRWTTVSIYQGHERWKSEGIQVGGIRSARGVVGHWFDRAQDPQGPCGPTAFWKVTDDQFATNTFPHSDEDMLIWDEAFDDPEDDDDDSGPETTWA